MKQKNNKLITLLAVLAFLAVPLEGLLGQHLQNDNANAKIKNAGVIRFVNATGEFQNITADPATAAGYDAAFLAGSSGTIEFAGTDNVFGGAAPIGIGDVNRINGWVVWSNINSIVATTDQNLDAQGLFFTNLGLSGDADKHFGAGIYNIDHIYISDRLGDRDYATSTIIYDGAGAGTEDQDVFAESGAAAATNAYYNLYFLNDGIKTLQTDAVNFQNNAVNEIDLDLNAVYIVKGTQQALGIATVNSTLGTSIDVFGGATAANDGWFRTNDGAGTLAGDVFIHTGGTYITDGAGLQTFSGNVSVGDDYTTSITNTSGSLTLDQGNMTFANASTLTLTNVLGHIVNGSTRLLLFEGSADFENMVAYGTGAGERSNMEFFYDPGNLALNSNTEYSGTDDIEAAGKDFPYGNLYVSSGANENLEAGTTVFVAGNFGLSGADLHADNGVNPVGGSSETLAMLNETASMTYSDALEVVGAVRRYTSNTSATMTFNNNATKLAITDNPANVNYVELAIWKGEMNTASDVSLARDVSRRTLFNVDKVAASDDWKAFLRLGYQLSEVPLAFQADDDYKNSLRFRKYLPEGGQSYKVTTGIAVNRHIAHDVLNGADGFAWAELYGFTTGDPDPDLSETVEDGEEVFLRGGPTWFITINNGRWSNPNTWDEGIQPGPNDLCLVRHTVWAGYVNQLDNYTVNETEHLQTNFTTDVSNLASYIQIFNAAAAGAEPEYNGALVFGEKAAADGAGTHELDPAWSLRETGVDLSDFQGEAGDPLATLTQGQIYITPKLGANASSDISDANIILQHQLDNASHTIYNGGLYVHAETQVTVPMLLTNKFTIQNAGTIIVGK